MICKKCIHSEVCKYKTEAVYECEYFKDKTIKNQYDRIRNMSIEEMAEFFNELILPYQLPQQVYKMWENNQLYIYGAWLKWLESEVDTE